jgi:hypothetical protein
MGQQAELLLTGIQKGRQRSLKESPISHIGVRPQINSRQTDVRPALPDETGGSA